MADPLCAPLSATLADAARGQGAKVHVGGTYVCMEGPQFSTRAESHLYRSWGGAIIGMTNLQEAKLAREAEICFATLALATDYDCWRESEEAVRVEDILAVLAANTELAQRTVAGVAAAMDDGRECACRRALDNAIVTAAAAVPDERRRELACLLARVQGTQEERVD